MPLFFDRRRDQHDDHGSPGPPARSQLGDLAAEFTHPAPPGLWTVHTETEPWRITDGQGVLQLLCDKTAVRRPDGTVLFRLAPNVAATMRPNLADGLIWGVINSALGTDPNVGQPNPAGLGTKSNTMAQSRWLVKDAAGVAVADIGRAADAAQIELLPAGPVNKRLIERRLSPEVVARIRALGPLRYSITHGGPAAGSGQLSGPAGQLIAIDQYAYGPPVKRAGAMRSELSSWTIEIVNNPFPASWLFALLRGSK